MSKTCIYCGKSGCHLRRFMENGIKYKCDTEECNAAVEAERIKAQEAARKQLKIDKKNKRLERRKQCGDYIYKNMKNFIELSTYVRDGCTRFYDPVSKTIYKKFNGSDSWCVETTKFPMTKKDYENIEKKGEVTEITETESESEPEPEDMRDDDSCHSSDMDLFDIPMGKNAIETVETVDATDANETSEEPTKECEQVDSGSMKSITDPDPSWLDVQSDLQKPKLTGEMVYVYENCKNFFLADQQYRDARTRYVDPIRQVIYSKRLGSDDYHQTSDKLTDVDYANLKKFYLDYTPPKHSPKEETNGNKSLAEIKAELDTKINLIQLKLESPEASEEQATGTPEASGSQTQATHEGNTAASSVNWFRIF